MSESGLWMTGLVVLMIVGATEAAHYEETCCSELNCIDVNTDCINGRCVCKSPAFRHPIHNQCITSIPPGLPCATYLLDSAVIQQCVHHATCMPVTSIRGQRTPCCHSHNHAVCVCDDGYYAVGTACEPRLVIGDPCHYHHHHDHHHDCDFPIDDQCPPHAGCVQIVDGTGVAHVCRCVGIYYVARNINGVWICVLEIPLGSGCQHNGVNNCADANAECIAIDGVSTCQCGDGYTQSGTLGCIVTMI